VLCELPAEKGAKPEGQRKEEHVKNNKILEVSRLAGLNCSKCLAFTKGKSRGLQ
jgi:hypothetical protein